MPSISETLKSDEMKEYIKTYMTHIYLLMGFQAQEIKILKQIKWMDIWVFYKNKKTPNGQKHNYLHVEYK